jgi:hypothetical protein
MSKQLYPKPTPKARKKTKAPKENLWKRPYHVQYTDPAGELEPEWGHYNTELDVKADAWYRVKVLGFHTQATLYDRDELRKQMKGVPDEEA